MDLSDDQLRRYARNMIMDEVGHDGQARLLDSRVLVVGAGGLGAPVLMYLAAAGIGTLGIVDHDRVDLSNLQRQIVHATGDIGRPKAVSAADTLYDINPEVTVQSHDARLTADNVAALVADYDLVVDCCDNFTTRFLVNDACHFGGKTLVSGAVMRFDGQVAVYKSHAGSDYPCYRCLVPAPPQQVQTCADAGVFGAVCGLVGSLQATEVLKERLGIGETLAGRLLIVDALYTTVRKVRIPRDPGCALCGDQPTITGIA
ncbi:molybdopterin-synthase adenylyltransferase MoeB [Magnetospira sp. QH-2]|uniref:HesA/MoeB/ThiF family protein n=1 Tax=Magnetospira sp. (strain QH-2) TaxID=1288970 RepID=UPI0003E80B62|nr:molybdopterin-synthase adenylyltransferase MoeB [Magnetospira sp. QH-2]CCQ75729.1 Molybdopterin biosynthesis protein moeB [Magnetospira sp. QH-2]